jgi:hypothetical protein
MSKSDTNKSLKKLTRISNKLISRQHTKSFIRIKKISVRKSISNKKKTTNKIISMMSNLKKFTIFYKNLTPIEKNILQNYKNNGYIEINKYLYNDIKINDLNINRNGIFFNQIKTYFSKETINIFDIKSINPGNIKQIVELYMNKVVIDQINVIDKIFTKPNVNLLQGNELLYRGSRGHSITTKNSKVGNEIIFKNFISTSTEQAISEKFIEDFMIKTQTKKQHCCMYVFHNMKDVPFIYLPWNINNSSKLNKQYINLAFKDEFEFLLPRGLKFKIIKKELIDFKNNLYTNKYIKKISFNKFDKMLNNINVNIDKINLSKMNDEDFAKIYNKITNKIVTYHLEYIGQEPLIPLQPFIYNSNINLHIENASDYKKTIYK